MNQTLARRALAAILLALTLSLPALAAEFDDTAAMLTGSIRFGGAGQAPSAELNLNAVARSTRLDQTVPLGGIHWDNRLGLAPSMLGAPLALQADEDGPRHSGWSWLPWVAGGTALTLGVLSQIEINLNWDEFFAAFFEGWFSGGKSHHDEPDSDPPPGDDEPPCDPGPLPLGIGSGCN